MGNPLPMRIGRRSVLKAGVSSLAVVAAPLIARAAADSTEAVRLNDKITVIGGVGCNVLALSGPDGLTLVDSGAAAHTGALLKRLRDLPGGNRVHTVFNTHWHPDQTGGNEVLGNANAQIVAHQKTLLWMATDHYVPTERRYEKARPKAALPTKTFYTRDSMTVGPEKVEYGYLLEAHTDGDCYVFCRDSNVLAVGHVASPVRDPELDWFGGGWVGGRLEALTTLVKLVDDQTQIVPSYGPVMHRAQLQAELDLWQQVYDRAITFLRKGYSYKDMLGAGVMQGLARTWSDPDAFMYSLCKGLWAHHNMLTHDIV